MMDKRHAAMNQVIHRLKTLNFPLEQADAIELFAREGDWQTLVYAPYVKSLEAWEINPKYYEGLRLNLPHAEIKITDTWKEIRKTRKKYDFIVVDAPQATYGEKDECCEHFGLLPDVLRIANDGCVIILNVNVTPYGLDEKPLWREHRRKYYKTDHPERLEFDEVIQHYESICKENNATLQWCFFQQRYTKFIYYFVMKVKQ